MSRNENDSFRHSPTSQLHSHIHRAVNRPQVVAEIGLQIESSVKAAGCRNGQNNCGRKSAKPSRG